MHVVGKILRHLHLTAAIWLGILYSGSKLLRIRGLVSSLRLHQPRPWFSPSTEELFSRKHIEQRAISESLGRFPADR